MGRRKTKRGYPARLGDGYEALQQWNLGASEAQKESKVTVDLSNHMTAFSGKPYVMVSGRVLLAHEDNPESLSIETDILQMDAETVTVKARVTTQKGTFTGHATSYVQTGSAQEKKTPLEVAETSAIGRALGVAGYAVEGGIASADEMQRHQDRTGFVLREPNEDGDWAALNNGADISNQSTEKQVKAIYAIGRAQKRLSEAQVDDRAVEVFGVRPQEMTKSEASQFIDMLKGEAAN